MHISKKQNSVSGYGTNPSPFFSAGIQPKLSISQPGDMYEQEADAMADHVMRKEQLQASSIQHPDTPFFLQRRCATCENEEKKKKEEENESEENGMPDVQRKCAACEEDDKMVQRKETGANNFAPSGFSEQLSANKGRGAPLNATTLASMNHSFETDFSNVRIHTGDYASHMNQNIQAKAFTHGGDIYFNQNEYNPTSQDGKRLLAHELTHVVQQGGSPKTIQRKLTVEPTYHPYLLNKLPGKDASKDTASSLSTAQRIAQGRSLLTKLCPDFQVDGTTGVVSPVDPKRKASDFAAGSKSTACCCLFILTRSTSTNDWRILVSDVVSAQTSESDHVVVTPGQNSPLSYTHWTKGPAEKQVLMSNEIVLGHELCGHAALMDLNAHPAETGRLTSSEHDPTINIQNLIAGEQGVAATDFRGLAGGGTHRGESTIRIVISGYPINKISPFSIPDASQIEKLNLATRFVQTNDFFVDVTGHTDSSGTDPVKEAVSLQRAQSIKSFIANRVKSKRNLDRFDPATPEVDRFTSIKGVGDTEPPAVALQSNPDNWRRVEIFMSPWPAGTIKPPSNTPTTVDPFVMPPAATTLASTGDDCEKKIVRGAYPGLRTPAVSPKLKDGVQRTCAECEMDDKILQRKEDGHGNIVPQNFSSQISKNQKSIIQRKAKSMSTIKDRLTRKLGDPTITDENVKDVLVILDALNATDLSDTVAAMDVNGYVDTLFNQVSDDDKQNFASLLRKIQLNRIRKLKDGSWVKDSCTAKEREVLNGVVAKTKAWAKKGFVAANGYVFDLEMEEVPDPAIDQAFERHFFHQATNGEISKFRKITYAQQVADNFEKVEVQNNPFTHECTQEFDPLCGALAEAYVSRGDSTVNYCDSFFKATPISQLSSIFHELVHVFAGVQDTGYGHERVYQYLPPEEAVNNASSYENFVIQILKPKGLSVQTSVSDSIEDASASQKAILKKRIAYGARMLTNALNVIGDPDSFTNNKGSLNEKFFKTTSRSELEKVIKRFKKADEAFNSYINVEYEKKCDEGDLIYNRHPGWAVHICPGYFSEGEDKQVDLLLLFIMERKGSGDIGNTPDSSAFTKEDKDEAYDNLWSYVGYARAVSEVFNSWKYLTAEFRYEREIADRFKALKDEFLPKITDEQKFRTIIDYSYVSPLQAEMLVSLIGTKTETKVAFDVKSKDHVDDLGIILKIGMLISNGLEKLLMETFLKETFSPEPDKTDMEDIIKDLEKRCAADLLKVLDDQFQKIKSNSTIDMAAVQSNIDAIGKKCIDALPLVEGYIPYSKEVINIDTQVYEYGQKLKTKLPSDKQIQWEIDLFDVSSQIGFEQMRMNSKMIDDMLSGKAFDPKNVPEETGPITKKYKEELDKKFKEVKKSK